MSTDTLSRSRVLLLKFPDLRKKFGWEPNTYRRVTARFSIWMSAVESCSADAPGAEEIPPPDLTELANAWRALEWLFRPNATPLRRLAVAKFALGGTVHHLPLAEALLVALEALAVTMEQR